MQLADYRLSDYKLPDYKLSDCMIGSQLIEDTWSVSHKSFTFQGSVMFMIKKEILIN